VSAVAFKKLKLGTLTTVFAFPLEQLIHKPSFRWRTSLWPPQILQVCILWQPWWLSWI